MQAKSPIIVYLRTETLDMFEWGISLIHCSAERGKRFWPKDYWMGKDAMFSSWLKDHLLYVGINLQVVMVATWTFFRTLIYILKGLSIYLDLKMLVIGNGSMYLVKRIHFIILFNLHDRLCN
ncbi:hypothetical protein O6H91_Y339400 [Diphasiastrum complanatum]|nr:hypothetical protein O6H91_Y339400 [Diphasiastrum complanatum]